ncbi:NUDIX domain-containing protein [Streptosporangium carneum]|uniref:ADP-ribose pyrophosphatase n=1 Tax=Streptosporangium carneum TaxID=47481 RepID=A0A9W6MFD7_9ACTN|nr:NUDIX hydrolase [Streptosporangium carneum]GLK11965.1 ADP-ribose pyrophosphatase [Streptosporangium carneum]
MFDADNQVIEQVSTKVAYETRYLRLREDRIRRPDGSPGIYSYVDKPDFALIIPMEDDGFHLVEQYRYPIRRRSWEFPQGTMPGMATADPERLAREELRQETGLSAGSMRHLGHLHGGAGMTSQGFDVFLATDLVHGTAELEVEEQDLRHQWFPREKVEEMIRTGVITEDSTLAAYTLLLLGA